MFRPCIDNAQSAPSAAVVDSFFLSTLVSLFCDNRHAQKRTTGSRKFNINFSNVPAPDVDFQCGGTVGDVVRKLVEELGRNFAFGEDLTEEDLEAGIEATGAGGGEGDVGENIDDIGTGGLYTVMRICDVDDFGDGGVGLSVELLPSYGRDEDREKSLGRIL